MMIKRLKNNYKPLLKSLFMEQTCMPDYILKRQVFLNPESNAMGCKSLINKIFNSFFTSIILQVKFSLFSDKNALFCNLHNTGDLHEAICLRTQNIQFSVLPYDCSNLNANAKSF